MSDPEDLSFPERVAELRRRRGLSQRELAAELRRSESWVSQVERGVQPVERLSVLQSLADVLGVPVRLLRPDAAAEPPPVAAANDLDGLRLALTGNPALPVLFARRKSGRRLELAEAERDVDRAWELAHSSQYPELTALLSDLLARLEEHVRTADVQRRPALHRLRARAYQAASAAFARQDEADAAWLAADRAVAAAEESGHRLDVIAAHFRMAHAFLGLHRHDQAERVAAAAAAVLQPRTAKPGCPPEELSLYGAMQLVLAVIAAREGDRTETRRRIADARSTAELLGDDRNDFNTEFGPTNVELHAVSVAVDMGDAGEALDLAEHVDPSGLSAERQARFYLDVARAHTQRRHVGEAIAALLKVEQHAPDTAHGHPLARETIRELVQLTGRRAPAELVELAQRSAALP